MPDGQGGSWISAKLMEFVHSTGLTYFWLLLMAVWGGTASYLARLRKHKQAFSFAELLGEWTISGFAGVVTAYLCMWASFPSVVTFAFAGIAGHMGGRAITLIESGVETWLKSRLGVAVDDKPE